MLAQLLDPGAAVTASLTVTPGASGSPAVKLRANAAPTPIQIVAGTASAQAGIGLGASNTSTGPNCVAAGYYNYCSGSSNLVTGATAYDYGQSGGFRLHSSYQMTSGSAGSNELWEQTLQATLSGTAAVRMTHNGYAISYAAMSAPVQASGHGVFSARIECSKATGDQAVWTIAAAFTRWGTSGGNLVLSGASGTGAPQIATSGLSGATLTLTADTTYQDINVSITPPSGNAATIGCTGHATYPQRIG